MGGSDRSLDEQCTRTESWPADVARRPLAPVRAWLRRPDRLRVEHRDTGEPLAVVVEDGGGSTPLVRVDGWFRGWFGSSSGDPPLQPPDDGLGDAEPDLRADGPVHRRPLRWQGGTVLSELGRSVHHGRPVWNALVQPTEAYDPRWSCCPLLLDTETDMPSPPSVVRAEAHQHHVLLDVETGVCVHVRQIGGTHDGWTLEVDIEEVGGPMDDRLFARG